MRMNLSSKMRNRTYQDAVQALNSLQSNYANIMAVRASGDRKNMMNIWEMQEWSRRIGYSVSDFNRLNVIHITGTKGKGSTAAFTQGILSQYSDKLQKIGLYTSPHLKSVRERIRLNGEPISEDKFCRYFFEVWDKLDATSSCNEKFPHMTDGAKPGYFKYLTLLSFHVFMQENCDTCIYEVGVGGEYDSTNIIEKPSVCGVSALGIDHTFMLGDTIDEIAWNKGGIFKKGASAYTIEGQPQEGLEMLKSRAIERSTSLMVVPVFDALRKVKLGIAGSFQVSNASLAVALTHTHLFKLKVLPEDLDLKSSSSLPEPFIRGLEQTRWDGRCQTLKWENINWYIDGAHTKESIEAASDWAVETFTNSPNKKILVFNQQSRDAKALLRFLHGRMYPSVKFDHVIFTTNVTWKSGTYSADLVSLNTSKEEVDNLSVQKALKDEWCSITNDESRVDITSSIESAVELVKSYNSTVDVFVTGSLHLVGGLLVAFDGRK